MTIPFYKPTPAPPGVFAGQPLPHKKANPLSRLFFHWVQPVFTVGYSRPLEPGDLWDLPHEYSSKYAADLLEANFMARMPPSRRPEKFKPKSAAIIEPNKEEDGPPLPQFQFNGERRGSAASISSRIVEKSQYDRRPSHVTQYEEDDIEELEVNLSDPSSNPLEEANNLERVLTRATTRTTHRHAHVEAEKPDEEEIKTFGKRKAKKIAAGKLAVEDGKEYDMSLVKALFLTTWKQWVYNVILGFCGNGLRFTVPLVTRKIIAQIQDANTYHNAIKSGTTTTGLVPPRSVGYGCGMAIGLACMSATGTFILYHLTFSMNILGCRMRAAAVDLVGRKTLRLSGKARLEMTNGRINTMVTADCSYLDWVFPSTVDLLTMPVMVAVGVGLLIYILGYSALVGLAVLVFTAPLQGYLVKTLLGFRRDQQELVDKRVRLLTEVINNVRVVKLYAYEKIFGAKVSDIREQEHAKLRSYGFLRASFVATFSFIPILAAVLTFITYSLMGHTLEAPIIFSGLQYFNVLRNPINQLPTTFAAVVDFLSGMERVEALLRADELKETLNIDPDAEEAIVVHGDFQYDSASPPDQNDDKEAKKKGTKKSKQEGNAEAGEAEGEATQDQVPFALRDIDLKIPRGALVCVVGRVGTGKSAFLSGLINEMRQVHGQVRFGGTISYVPQHAWVQSGTVRENIAFGSSSDDMDPIRVKEVIDACALRTDIEETKIGEKGITLSGGQRQRICIARAAYSDTDIVLLDDPLSAVDANVGHHLLNKCILQGPFSHRTRILVTHQLDVLRYSDLILVMDRDEANEGRITQSGTYESLLQQQGTFRTLIEEFGSSHAPAGESGKEDPIEEDLKPKKEPTGGGGKLIMDEERNIGSVSWRVYYKYTKATGSWIWAVGIFALLTLNQIATVGNALILGFWSEGKIKGFSQGQYMAVYAGLGIAIAITTWAGIYSMVVAGLRASRSLFNGAWYKVMRSPTSWHDRTPTGRIISRLSKDIEMLDDRLMVQWFNFMTYLFAFFGAIGLIIYTFPWLGFIFIPLIVFYCFSLLYYRQTSRELKRVDSLMRSHIYSSFAEQLAGLPIIRAFNRQSEFVQRLQLAIDQQNQIYTISLHVGYSSEWKVMILLIGVFGSIFRNNLTASKFGVVFTYALTTTSTMNQMVATLAYCEQEMNNVERIQYYNDLGTEADTRCSADPTDDESWPTEGALTFENVQLRYRPELPLVLKGLTFNIKPGEKVGVIGRTGAGKSSVAQALFRTVEICGGKISVDGRDLKDLGLDTLRERLAIIPQEAFLFAGTVRENIDPHGKISDADLNDALNLVHNSPNASDNLREKFKLDAQVQNEGINFSAGERQLLALMRALVRRCKVLLLDEATSSVDPETDALIQRIIQTELSDVTLISIAHRLQTVAFYDRILVLDAGKLVEFDTPLNLFDQPESIFKSLCDKKNLHREDILKIQQEAAAASGHVLSQSEA